MILPAETIAEIALQATGHRNVNPDMVRWVAKLVELVRRMDEETVDV